MVKAFDEAFVAAAAERLAALPPEQAPDWGSMRPPQVLAHLTTAVRYSLNKEALTPDEGGFMGHHIAKRLILGGLIKLPKGAKAPKFYAAGAKEGSADALKSESIEFVQGYGARTLEPPAHPFFGPLTLDEWAKLHRTHFDHHLKQFGIVL